MENIHHRWDKSGRTFRTEKSGQYVYKSAVGQRNVNRGDDIYFPYIYDSENKIVRFGDCELRLLPATIQISRGSDIFEFAFHPENEESGVWQRPSAQANSLTMIETETDEAVNYFELSYNLTTTNQETTVIFKGGGSDRLRFNFNIVSKVAGKQRLVLEHTFTETPKEIYFQKGPASEDTYFAGYEFDFCYLIWTEEEEIDRKSEIEGNIFDLHFGEKYYEKGEIKRISPETWGPTETSDDCFTVDGAYYDHLDSYLWIGEMFGGFYYSGMIWSNVTAYGAAENGTNITIYGSSVGGTGAHGSLKIEDNDSPAAWGGSPNRPEDRTPHAITIIWNEAGSGTQVSPELKTLIQQRFDDDHDAGDDMAIVWITTPATVGSIMYLAEESTGAVLTIVYSAGPEAGPYKFKYRKGGATVEITTYVEDPAGWNQTLAIRANNTIYYAQCDSNLSHANATDLRVRIGGVTYAVLHTEGTPT